MVTTNGLSLSIFVGLHITNWIVIIRNVNLVLDSQMVHFAKRRFGQFEKIFFFLIIAAMWLRIYLYVSWFDFLAIFTLLCCAFSLEFLAPFENSQMHSYMELLASLGNMITPFISGFFCFGKFGEITIYKFLL